MRFLVSSACLVSGLCLATPASADFAGKRSYGSVPAPRSPVMLEATPGPAVGRDLGEARERIRAARKAGLISRRQARRLKREANVIARHAELYGRDGFSQSERDEIETRSLYLMDSVRPAPSDGGASD